MWNKDAFEAMPAALDIGSEYIRVMQFSRSDEQLRVDAAARRIMPVESARESSVMGRYLRQAMDAAPFSTREVIAALPACRVQVRTVRIDPAAAGDIERAVRQTSRDQFPFDLSEARLQCINAGLVRQAEREKLEIIAIASLHQHIDALLDAIELAKLTPVSLRMACFAGLHCARRQETDSPEIPRASVEIHDTSTSVMI